MSSSAPPSQLSLSTYTAHLDSRMRCRLLDVYRWNARYLDALHVTVFNNLDLSSDPTFAFDCPPARIPAACEEASQVLSDKRHALIEHLSTTICGHNQSVNEDADGSHDYLRIGSHLYPEHIGGSIRMLHLSVKYICRTHVNRTPPQEEPQYRDLGDPTEEFLTDLTYCLIHSGVTGVGTRYRTDFIDNPSLGIRFGTTSSTFVASAIIMLCRVRKVFLHSKRRPARVDQWTDDTI